jgi:hypothetical protein
MKSVRYIPKKGRFILSFYSIVTGKKTRTDPIRPPWIMSIGILLLRIWLKMTS